MTPPPPPPFNVGWDCGHTNTVVDQHLIGGGGGGRAKSDGDSNVYKEWPKKLINLQ